MNKNLLIAIISCLIVFNVILLRKNRKTHVEIQKCNVELTNSIFEIFQGIHNVDNIKLNDTVKLFDRNKGSLATSELSFSKVFLYINEFQCSSCIYEALEQVSKIKNEKISIVVNYENEVWMKHIIEKKLKDKIFFYSKSKFLINSDEISYPIFFYLNKDGEIKNPLVFSQNPIININYLKTIIHK